MVCEECPCEELEMSSSVRKAPVFSADLKVVCLFLSCVVAFFRLSSGSKAMKDV